MTMFHSYIELPEGKADLAFRRFSVKNHVATAPAMIPGCRLSYGVNLKPPLRHGIFVDEL